MISVSIGKRGKSFKDPPKLSICDVDVIEENPKLLEGSINSHDNLDPVSKRLKGKKRSMSVHEGSVQGFSSQEDS